MSLGKQEVRQCPCGCKKWVVWPLFDRPEASFFDKAVAEEVVRRLNSFESSAKGEV